MIGPEFCLPSSSKASILELSRKLHMENRCIELGEHVTYHDHSVLSLSLLAPVLGASIEQASFKVAESASPGE
jgi:hypothetical protein